MKKSFFFPDIFVGLQEYCGERKIAINIYKINTSVHEFSQTLT